MIQAPKITKVSEEPYGEWTKTVWSDGQVLLHRPIAKTTLNPCEENREAVLPIKSQA